MDEQQFDFSGVWRSSYYKVEDPKVVTEHYVTVRLMGNQLILESIPGPNESYLLGRFTVDGRVLTGSYQSQNSPNNSTKDALYYGAAQLVLDKDGRAMRGMGVGFGSSMRVNSTVWEVVHVGHHDKVDTSRKA
jgi:hypothetical protein